VCRSYFLQISVGQVDPAPLYRLRDLFGGSVSGGVRKRSGGRGQWISYDWKVTSRDALAFLEAIHPHLIVKRREVEVCIAFQREKIAAKNVCGANFEREAQRQEEVRGIRKASRIPVGACL
jgi:hypothetical protein